MSSGALDSLDSLDSRRRRRVGAKRTHRSPPPSIRVMNRPSAKPRSPSAKNPTPECGSGNR